LSEVPEMPDSNWLLIVIAIATPVTLVVILGQMVDLLAGAPRRGVMTLSLSYAELFDFALAEADRTEALKIYFQWKHEVLLEMLKAVGVFALANLALTVKFVVDPDPSTVGQVQKLVGLQVGPSILAGIGAVLVIAVWLTWRLRRIPVEFSAAVRFVDMVR
jgi:hypothetical protein